MFAIHSAIVNLSPSLPKHFCGHAYCPDEEMLYLEVGPNSRVSFSPADVFGADVVANDFTERSNEQELMGRATNQNSRVLQSTSHFFSHQGELRN